jgi:penicillin-binding protein 2
MVLQVSVVMAFAALAISFWFLQIVQHARFEEMAASNHQRTLALRAPRGVLFDRNGKVLVENHHTFNIALVREQSKNLDATLHTLALATGATSRQSSRSSSGIVASRPTSRSW